MDPDSEPNLKTLKDVMTPHFNVEHTIYEEEGEFKNFYFTYFNDSNRSLVTGQASFNQNYELQACDLSVTLLDKTYNGFKKERDNLSLDEMFILQDKLQDNYKYTLSYNENNLSIIAPYGEITPLEFLNEALKEERINDMDIHDQMVDYLCHKINKSHLYKSLECFKYTEKMCEKKTKAHIIAFEKAS